MKESYIAILSWMRSVLGLKGNELICYALLFGFCQDGESKFSGSLNYITEWLGTSKSTTELTLRNLCEKNLIEKIPYTINGVKFAYYVVNKEILKSVGYTENRYGGIPKIGTNNIKENIEKENILLTKNRKESRHTYGKYNNVFLSDKEFETFKNERPNDWQERIEELSEGIDSKGYKYKNFLSTLRNWCKNHDSRTMNGKQPKKVVELTEEERNLF